jgi:hypothetical protein
MGPAAPPNFVEVDLLARLVVSFAIIWALPNTLQILGPRSPATGVSLTPAPGWMVWRTNLPWAVLVAGLLFTSIIQMRGTGAFLYFQF